MWQELTEAVAPLFVEAVALLVTFFIGWAAVRFKKLTGIQIEEKHQRALHSAIMSGVRAAVEADGPERARAAKSAVIAKAMAHAKESVPDAIAALKPGGYVMDRLAERYLNDALGGR